MYLSYLTITLNILRHSSLYCRSYAIWHAMEFRKSQAYRDLFYLYNNFYEIFKSDAKWPENIARSISWKSH